MKLDAKRRRLLAHIADDPHSRILAFRISTDPETGEAVLTCLHEYFAGVEDPTGPWHLLPLELARGSDEHPLWALTKSLAADYRAAIQDWRRADLDR